MKEKLIQAASELQATENRLARQQRALEAESLRAARRVAELSSVAKATGRVITGLNDLIVDWNATK